MSPYLPDHPVIRNMERTGYPDGKPPKVICICSECGAEIFEGEKYYNINGEPWCEECIEGTIKYAEIY